MNLPDRSGSEVLKQIRSDPANAAMPVVVVTTLAQKADREALIAAGATDFLAKPIDIQTFTTALKRHLGQ
jgi:CheY-like chemotaxis protein